jgi:hypothetical protein
LTWLGPFISDSVEPASAAIRDIFHNIWMGMQKITGSHHY